MWTATPRRDLLPRHGRRERKHHPQVEGTQGAPVITPIKWRTVKACAMPRDLALRLYAGAEQGPGAYHGANTKHKFQDIGTVLEPDCWYFLSVQGNLATILNKLQWQWFVKVGVSHTASGHEITTHQVGALAKATIGTVYDTPDIAVSSPLAHTHLSSRSSSSSYVNLLSMPHSFLSLQKK